ncbi:MAG TPA: TlpA disulfide reductase family protein [Anaerolineales bacterium]|nr:TlpA disulfide reductase family protein [Anaerolineales bacterium]
MKKVRRRSQKPYPILPMAAGLLLIGFALVIMTSPKSGSAAESSSSVVPVAVSFAAPELSLENLNGQTESLADYRDHVVLVNNWATWCPPCKAEMPTLAAYYREHQSEGFTIIAVEAGDPVETVAPFVQNYNLEFPVWLDPGGVSVRTFGNGTLPNSYVIDRAGTVRYAWTGEINKAMLEKYVTPLLMEDGR